MEQSQDQSRPAPKLRRASSSFAGRRVNSVSSILFIIAGFIQAAFTLLFTAYDVVFEFLFEYFNRVVGNEYRSEAHRLEKALANAKDHDEWYAAAEKLDELNGKKAWKNESASEDYDYELISKRLAMLRQTRLARDLWGLVFILRSGLSRNIGGIGNPELFQHSLVGTKKVIEEYVMELNECLLFIARAQHPEFNLSAKIEFFASLRKVYGRSALLLSGGATLGMYHIGIIKALFENRLLPRIFSGSSAGSLMAALVCTRTDEELPLIFDPANISLEAIERRGEGTARRRLARLLKTGYLFDVNVLQECVRQNCGDTTFLEAYNRTRRVLNITVSSSTVYELPRLLNYLTAPNVLIWSAASASCAIPGLYQPVPLMAKTKTGEIVPWNPPGTQWVDGSVENDLPMARLSEQLNVNHFIVSQVNPHVIPFLQQTSTKVTKRRGFLDRLQYLISSELQHRLSQLFELGIFPRVVTRVFYWTRSLISQTYTGDITIVPPIVVADYFKLMTNPNAAEVRINIVKAERATWQKMSIIKMHCETEKKLDDLLYRLRVQQLEKVGRPYRPIEFALSLSDTAHAETESTALSVDHDDANEDQQLQEDPSSLRSLKETRTRFYRSQSLGSNMAGRYVAETATE